MTERRAESVEHGFTLIEVLVALSLTALVATLAYGSLTSSMNASERSLAESRRLQQLDRAISLLEKDLSQAIERGVVDRYGDRDNAMIGDGEYVEFTRLGWPNPAGHIRSELQRVGWYYHDGSLWRDYAQSLDGYDRQTMVQNVLLEGLDSFRLEYMRDTVDGLDASYTWLTDWGQGRNNDTLPVAIRLTIELEDWGEISRVFSLPPGG